MGLRIEDGVTRSPLVRFKFDGQEVEGHEGESVASALLAAGIRTLRRAPVDGGSRGLFCAMGICQECAIEADGRVVEACRLPLRADLDIRSRR